MCKETQSVFDRPMPDGGCRFPIRPAQSRPVNHFPCVIGHFKFCFPILHDWNLVDLGTYCVGQLFDDPSVINVTSPSLTREAIRGWALIRRIDSRFG